MTYDVHFTDKNQSIDAKISENGQTFHGDFEQIQVVTEYVGGGPYTGEYIVTPKVGAQTLPTKEKVMLDDLTVREIPYAVVQNTSGGNTATIA